MLKIGKQWGTVALIAKLSLFDIFFLLVWIEIVIKTQFISRVLVEILLSLKKKKK